MSYKNKDTQKEYQRLWMQKRRRNYFKDKRCSKCESTKRLEIDHIDPKTKVANAIWSWSLARREKELRKCQVLCYFCHKKKHEAKHGTWRRYDVYKCRCKLCLKQIIVRKTWPSRINQS
jgi:hypothetical protein